MIGRVIFRLKLIFNSRQYGTDLIGATISVGKCLALPYVYLAEFGSQIDVVPIYGPTARPSGTLAISLAHRTSRRAVIAPQPSRESPKSSNVVRTKSRFQLKSQMKLKKT